jgi:hypothetical protein
MAEYRTAEMARAALLAVEDRRRQERFWELVERTPGAREMLEIVAGAYAEADGDREQFCRLLANEEGSHALTEYAALFHAAYYGDQPLPSPPPPNLAPQAPPSSPRLRGDEQDEPEVDAPPENGPVKNGHRKPEPEEAPPAPASPGPPPFLAGLARPPGDRWPG